jgi:hypothetical protein
VTTRSNEIGKFTPLKGVTTLCTWVHI